MGVSYWHLEDKGISSVEGIQYFTNLIRLYLYDNELKELDVTGLTKLETLQCQNNQITEIKGLEDLVSLESLNCENNKLTSFNVSEFIPLKYLYLGHNCISGTLDVSTLTSLVNLQFYDNYISGTLDVSMLPNLVNINGQENYLTEVVLNSSVVYDYLYFSYNHFTSKDDIKNWDENDYLNYLPMRNVRVELSEANFPDTAFREVLVKMDDNEDGYLSTREANEDNYGYWNLRNKGIADLTGIELLNQVNPIVELYCSENKLSGVLDLSGLESLADLNLSKNQLTGVILDENKDYNEWCLYFRYNQITSPDDVKGIDASESYFWPQGEAVSVDITEENFPDDEFRSYILEQYDRDGDEVLSVSEIESATSFSEYSTDGVDDFTGIEHLRALEYLRLDDAKCKNLTKLPDSVEEFNCSGCGLTSLPELSVSLRRLSCQINNLSSLPEMPAGLIYLNCYDNKFTQLPELPASLTELNCSDNKLTSLPELPEGLEKLTAETNALVSLPELPNSIKYIDVYNNKLTVLPKLPANLKELHVNNNALTELPALPDKLEKLFCQENELVSLPELPEDLEYLDVENNKLTSLPKLPEYLVSLNIRDNEISGTLDVSELTGLRYLYAYNNKITSVILCEDAKYNTVNLRMNWMSSTDDVIGDDEITWETNGCYFDRQKNTCEKYGHKYKGSGSVSQQATFSKDGYGYVQCTRSGCYNSQQNTIPKVKSVKLSKTSYTYSNKTFKPSVTVKDSEGNTLKNGTDYDVTYAKGRKAVGRYSVKITLKGSYSGTKTLYFNIMPKAPSKVTLAMTKYNAVKVSWSKCTGATKYTVYYKKATASKYTKLTTTTKTYVTKTGLAAGTKYEFKVVPCYKSGSKTVESENYKANTVTTLKKAAAPVVEKSSATKVKVSWEKVTGASGYVVTYKTGSTTKTVTTTSTSKLITVTKNKSYTYTVKAYKTVNGKKIYAPASSATKFTLK